jgi:hypothetical protein
VDIFNHLSAVSDPIRDINVKHNERNLLDVLFLVLTAILSSAQGWKDIKVFGDASAPPTCTPTLPGFLGE